MHLNNRARELLDGYSAGMAQQFGARDASRLTCRFFPE